MGTTLGTPAYMAPEQAAGDPSTNHRADIYAFGCMAYELLTGRPPFHGRTPHKLMAAHMGERPQPVSELRPDTPPVLADLVMGCLEKEPDHRPQSAADLARVLETVTSGTTSWRLSSPSTCTAQPALPEVLLGGRVGLTRALGLYAAAFVTVAVLAPAAIVGRGCAVCAYADIARAHDLAGNADSVIANFERFLAGPAEPIPWLIVGSLVRAGAHKRLGELYEAKGDRGRAMSHYAQFIELWKDADPDLQPLVRQARDRLAALQRAER